jgi:hypothetical protein
VKTKEEGINRKDEQYNVQNKNDGTPIIYKFLKKIIMSIIDLRKL